MTAQHGAPEGQILGAPVHRLSHQSPEPIRSEATPAAPERAMQGITEDVATVGGVRHG